MTDDADSVPDPAVEDPVVSCDFQGGTLSVHEDGITIERTSNSMFEDKFIPIDEVWDVDYSGGILSGHIQIKQDGIEHDDGGLFSHPVDENTLYFPRTKRPAAKRAQDAILERI
ncbi:MAG: hypothetical protein BRD23_05840 [Halobacteriales archaeon SW_9_67_25]|jgi:hypothetical protein|nr:MAG: hypothetical protein BRD23_05840 [Halobacteriales archaeon SW_9_67_25]